MTDRRWTAVLARLGTPTGDGRILMPGGITSRDLPMPLMWQEKTEEGHGGSFTIGAIDTIEILDDMVTASGSLLDLFPDRDRVIEMIEKGVIGPSVDLADNLAYEMDDMDRILITQASIGGATLVPIEAFSDVSIHMATPGTEGPDLTPVTVTASAASEAVLPPLEWFSNPHLDEPTPITITDEGRVFGHIAPWGVCHLGLPGCVTAPSSVSEYAYFLVGAEKTAEGVTVPVGKLTVGGGHADPNAGFVAAAEHYDNVGTAVASVFAGEDEHGIWVAGYLVPGVAPETVAALQRSPISGDWRRVGGNLELVAAHAVNVPGFPVPRARVTFSLGEQHSLIGRFTVAAPVKTPEASAETPAVDNGVSARARLAWALRKGR